MSDIFLNKNMFPTLNQGKKNSPGKQRKMEVESLLEKFNGKDQYIVVTPVHYDEAIKVVDAETAAKMIADRQAHLANKDEIEAFKLQDEQSRHEVEKTISKLDLAKSMQRMLGD